MNHAEYNRAVNWSPSPYKLQGRWTFNDFYGKPWPVFFPLKGDAETAGQRHIKAVLERIRYGNGTVQRRNEA